MRDCPYTGNSGGAAQPTGSAAGSSSSSVAMHPTGSGTSAPAGHGRGRGGASGTSGLQTAFMLWPAARTKRHRLMSLQVHYWFSLGLCMH